MKKAIVIGASSGIGREVAKILINDGWRVAVAARRCHLLNDLQCLSPETVICETIDVCGDDAPYLLRLLIDRLGGMDLFFYASGIGFTNTTLEANLELQTLATNGLGFTKMIGEAFRFMVEQGSGQIAAISSIAGTKGIGSAPAYSATKAFQNTYLQALQQQAAARGLNIRITDIRPGFVDTALLAGADTYPLLMKPEKVAKHIVKAVYRRRFNVVIDWRWRLITSFWRLIPNGIWRRMKVGF